MNIQHHGEVRLLIISIIIDYIDYASHVFINIYAIHIQPPQQYLQIVLIFFIMLFRVYLVITTKIFCAQIDDVYMRSMSPDPAEVACRGIQRHI